MLFKSQPENYNPQIHTEELSLASQMDKNPAVHNKVISRFERWTKMTSFLYHTGRVNGGVAAGRFRKPTASRDVWDNAYRVQKRTINIPPAVCMGGAYVGAFFDADNAAPNMTAVTDVQYTGGKTAANITTDTMGSVAIKHDPDNKIFGDKMNIGDTFQLTHGLGTELIILRIRRASTDDHYVYDFKTSGQASDWDEDSFNEDEVMMEGGSRFGEGSLKGGQRFWGTEWDIHYAFISRYSLAFTGSALAQKRVVWTDKTRDGAHQKGNANRLWQFELEWESDELFNIHLELACRFAKSSMDPSTHAWFQGSGTNRLTMSHIPPEMGITPPRIPDGWVTSIKDTIDLTYDVNTGPTPALIEGIMQLLAGNSPAGQQGNTFVVLTDTIGEQWLDKILKTLVGWNTSGTGIGTGVQGHNTDVLRNITTGRDITVGFQVKGYYYLGNEIIVMCDELMSHPGLNTRKGGFAGSGDMYFLNVSPDNEGVSNFELFSKANGRHYKKKYVDGMHSLDSERDKSLFASSGFDGAFVHVLAELFPITYYKETSAILRATGSYNGGALAAMPNLNLWPSIINS